jgi:hypothetical protein
MLLCCGYLIVSELSTNIYGLNIFLLLFSPVIWMIVNLICESIFPFVGEFLITVDSKQLSISRKISIAVYKQNVLRKDIVSVGQLYFIGSSPGEDDPPVIFKKCFIKTNNKQIFFGAYIKQENKDAIIAEINKFIFE